MGGVNTPSMARRSENITMHHTAPNLEVNEEIVNATVVTWMVVKLC